MPFDCMSSGNLQDTRHSLYQHIPGFAQRGVIDNHSGEKENLIKYKEEYEHI
jgi:hypothetical protein